ncbi:hypothetical protein [Latilactobacillus sakei]|uniref:hypothetical protein n=1 Tax=Latilactobacillus sakei TaxID=1599 RepID=UPI000DC64543|nr:hypothetical protein [Latilactobacillus sakei]SPS07496.1 hypothetical protein LAS9624_01751 [Latilactobacillus sakei]
MQPYIDKLKKLDRKWLIAIATVVVVGLGFFIWNGQRKYDPAKDIKVSFYGYNGSGDVSVNRDEIKRKAFEYIGKKEGLNGSDIARLEENNLNYSNMTDIYSKAEKAVSLTELVSIDVSKPNNLSNGDKVTVSVTVPSKDIKVKPVTKKLTVKGLKKVKILTAKDIASHLNIKFVGYDGLGQAQITSKKYDYKTINVKHNGRLKNGDQIKLNVAKLVDSTTGTKFSGDQYVKVKVTGLTDLKKIPNMDDIIKLNTEYAKNENKSDESISFKIDKMHTYASESTDGIITGSYTSDYIASPEVVINEKVRVSKLTIYTLFKITRTITGSKPTSVYSAYGLKRLSVEDGRIDLASKSTESDGIFDSSQDSLPIIQKQIEKTAVLIK